MPNHFLYNLAYVPSAFNSFNALFTFSRNSGFSLLTAMAGLLGLSAGVFLLDFINRLLLAMPSDEIIIKDPSVNIQIAVIATVILLVCGLLAGLIPAWRAMQIKAIDALRDE